MADDSLLELVNSAIATLLEVKQRLEEGEGIAKEPQSPDGWKPVDFFDSTPGPVTADEMQQAEINAQPETTPTATSAQHNPAAEPLPQAQPRFCRNCGNELSPGSRFCRECGQPVD